MPPKLVNFWKIMLQFFPSKKPLQVHTGPKSAKKKFGLEMTSPPPLELFF